MKFPCEKIGNDVEGRGQLKHVGREDVKEGGDGGGMDSTESSKFGMSERGFCRAVRYVRDLFF